MMQQLRAFLTSLFPLSYHDFNQLLPHVVPQAVAKGHHVLVAGQVCDAVYFVTAGLLRLYYVGANTCSNAILNCWRRSPRSSWPRTWACSPSR